MDKFYGAVGFSESITTVPGVFEDHIVERFYYGDVIRKVRKIVEPSTGVNDNITMSNSISIIADETALQNVLLIKYVKYLGVAWKVLSAEAQYPRLILTLGDKYNEQKA